MEPSRVRARGRGRGRGRGSVHERWERRTGRHQRAARVPVIPNDIRATIVDHVVNHGLTMAEAGRRVQPNLSRSTVSSIVQILCYRIDPMYKLPSFRPWAGPAMTSMQRPARDGSGVQDIFFHAVWPGKTFFVMWAKICGQT
ncbi:hypothetical protein AAFF_G00441550 [Aldrovandia affinis]|uniref:Transposase n=1 Tax=Aldrovandia affinis TaxID=143900 RepID=A0AAD7S7A5_9TELE|nr:hypothetical protein AAFF_G00441550 [Aldrovandia affinis]